MLLLGACNRDDTWLTDQYDNYKASTKSTLLITGTKIHWKSTSSSIMYFDHTKGFH